MNLTEIRQILAESDIRLTKSLGQNFLHDSNQLRRIVESGDLSESDSVLEIGPGLGPLTELLLPACGKVFAIEKDERLVGVLKQRFAGESRLELRHDDALRYLKRSQEHDWSNWKLVANLPYSVGSPILVELALAPRGPARMVATLQWEVVQRIKASPGTKDYGLLSLLLQQGYDVAGSFKVPAGCFFPRPDVASACVCLVRRSVPLLNQEELKLFTKLVKVGFSQRRKVMMKLLRNLWPESALQEAFERADLQAQVRAEAVSVDQFVQLTRTLIASDLNSKKGENGRMV